MHNIKAMGFYRPAGWVLGGGFLVVFQCLVVINKGRVPNVFVLTKDLTYPVMYCKVFGFNSNLF